MSSTRGGGEPARAVAPTADDPVVRALSEGVGGPLGTRALRHPWWTPVRVLLALTALTMAIGMWQKGNCYQDTWQNSQARYSHMCYSDLPYLYTGRGFAELKWPYSDDQDTRSRYEVMEYPVGIAYWAYGTAWLTHVLHGSPPLAPRAQEDVGALSVQPGVLEEIRIFVSVNAVGFAVIALLSTWLLSKVNPRRPWDAATFALSPALLLTGLVNWDILAVGLVAGAMWAWSRDKPLLTGVLIGLGTATKLYPLFLLGAVLVICLRERRGTAFLRVVLGTLFAWLVANLPALLSSRPAWSHFWSFNNDRPADLGSPWLVLQQVIDSPSHPFAFTAATINVVSLALFALWCVAVFLLGMAAPTTPRLAQLGFLLVAGFLLVNKVYSPQYVLWLLPLAVLARPRWRDQIIWQATEVAYFASVWWYLGGYLAPSGGGDVGFYWIAVVLRMAGELYLVVVVARDVLRPRLDPVRADDVPEPPDSPIPRQVISTRSNAVAV